MKRIGILGAGPAGCALAIQLVRAGRDVVVFDGGPPTAGDAFVTPVAVGLCEALGVPADRLILEEASTTTLENAAFAATALRAVAPEAEAVLVVSDGFHLFRCRRMFLAHFAKVDTAGALPPRRARAKLALREVGAVIRHGLAGRL